MSFDQASYENEEQAIRDAFAKKDERIAALECENAELRAEIERMRAFIGNLLKWDKKYPKGTIYNFGEHTKCEAELTSLIEDARAYESKAKP